LTSQKSNPTRIVSRKGFIKILLRRAYNVGHKLALLTGATLMLMGHMLGMWLDIASEIMLTEVESDEEEQKEIC
jgi:hypothetical protein